MTVPGELLSTLVRALGAKRNGRGWLARCPAHDDHEPSLSIAEQNGTVLVHCHAGCPQDTVLSALRERGLWPQADSTTAATSRLRSTSPVYPSAEAAIRALSRTLGGAEAGTWVYRYADGREAFRVVRLDRQSGSKEYRPIHHDGNGWVVGAPSGPWPLYGLLDLAKAHRVCLVEGEKCADAAKQIGLTATTSAHGANAPQRTDWFPLAGKEVIALPDNDAAGRRYVEVVAGILGGLKPRATVRLVTIPGLPEGGDLADYVDLRDSTENLDIGRHIEHLADHTPELVSAENSIRAPKESERARIEFPEPVPLSQLGDGVSITWLWDGYLAVDHITLLTGLWKAGKTTLLSHLLRAFGAGGDLAGAVSEGQILVVSEESRGLWARRRDDLGIGDHVALLCRPFLGRPTGEEWREFVAYLAALVRRDGYTIIVFDTVAVCWPVSDENDASKVIAALQPLHAITELGAGVLLVHHPRKGDAGEGQAARGSGALPGFVDVIIELRRLNPKNREDRRRVLTAYSRFDETTPEVVLELTDDEYRTIGTKADARQSDRLAVISNLLPATEPGFKADEILDAWPDDSVPRPSKRLLQSDLKHGASTSLWIASGEGRKNDPFRYSRSENSIRARPLSLDARIESDAETAPLEGGTKP